VTRVLLGGPSVVGPSTTLNWMWWSVQLEASPDQAHQAFNPLVRSSSNCGVNFWFSKVPPVRALIHPLRRIAKTAVGPNGGRALDRGNPSESGRVKAFRHSGVAPITEPK